MITLLSEFFREDKFVVSRFFGKIAKLSFVKYLFGVNMEKILRNTKFHIKHIEILHD